jgi:hypothetical protein
VGRFDELIEKDKKIGKANIGKPASGKSDPVPEKPRKNTVSKKTAQENSETGKKRPTVPNPSKEKPVRKKKEVESDYDDDQETDLGELIEQAQEAQLKEKISKAELAAYKVEKERLALDLKAGNIAEVKYMEFVYLSHIEKMYIDMHRMADKIEAKINPFVQERDIKGVTKTLKKEISETIRSVKQGQKEAARSWKKDLRESK